MRSAWGSRGMCSVIWRSNSPASTGDDNRRRATASRMPPMRGQPLAPSGTRELRAVSRTAATALRTVDLPEPFAPTTRFTLGKRSPVASAESGCTKGTWLAAIARKSWSTTSSTYITPQRATKSRAECVVTYEHVAHHRPDATQPLRRNLDTHDSRFTSMHIPIRTCRVCTAAVPERAEGQAGAGATERRLRAAPGVDGKRRWRRKTTGGNHLGVRAHHAVPSLYEEHHVDLALATARSSSLTFRNRTSCWSDGRRPPARRNGTRGGRSAADSRRRGHANSISRPHHGGLGRVDEGGVRPAPVVAWSHRRPTGDVGDVRAAA
jgi:hypothetical protein